MPGIEDFALPNAEAIADTIKAGKFDPPDFVSLPENHAASSELAATFHKTAKQHFDNFCTQTERTELENKLNNADAKYRMSPTHARRFGAGSAQEMNTLSNVASPQFHQSVNLLAMGICRVMIPDDDECPVVFKPKSESADYDDAEGQRVADEETAYAKSLWTDDGWKDFVTDSVHYAIKNSMDLIAIEYERIYSTQIERVPGYYDGEANPVALRPGEQVPDGIAFNKRGQPIGMADIVDSETGKPRHFVFMPRTRIVHDGPSLARIPLKNSYFDLSIETESKAPLFQNAFRNHHMVGIRSQKPLSFFIEGAQSGDFDADQVAKIGKMQLFDSETKYASNVRNDQDMNAAGASSGLNNPNGLFDVMHVYMRATVNEKKAKWDEKSPQVLYEAVFVGDFNSFSPDQDGAAGCVCVQLRRYPYHHGEFPFQLVHSHRDERGAMSLGAIDLLACNVEEQDTTMNQHLDCKTLRIYKPMLARRGGVLERELKFRRGGHVIWCKDVDRDVKQLQTEDVTSTTLPTLDRLENQANKTLNTNDAFRGEVSFSRTTATQATEARQQALMPIIAQGEYMAAQYFPWMFKTAIAETRQFCDPAKAIRIAGGDEFVNPALWYGEHEVSITSVKKFAEDLTMRNNLVNLLQAGAYDKSLPIMGKEGALEFWRQYGKAFRFQNPEKIWPATRKYVEAENQAWNDYRAILADPQGALMNQALAPKPEEDQQTHLGVLEPLADQWEKLSPAMPDAERAYGQQVLATLRYFIAVRNQLLSQQNQTVAGASGGPAQPGASGGVQSPPPPGMSGEQVGDVMAGQGGQMVEGMR
jgi:hypothetical protein